MGFLLPLVNNLFMCSFQLKRKLFAIWVRYCQWRRFRKSQYGKADYHFRERALPRFVLMSTFSTCLIGIVTAAKRFLRLLEIEGVGDSY